MLSGKNVQLPGNGCAQKDYSETPSDDKGEEIGPFLDISKIELNYT